MLVLTVIKGEADEDIQRSISNFDQAMESKLREVRQMQQTVTGINKEIEDLRRQTDNLNLKKGQHTFIIDQVSKLLSINYYISLYFTNNY